MLWISRKRLHTIRNMFYINGMNLYVLKYRLNRCTYFEWMPYYIREIIVGKAISTQWTRRFSPVRFFLSLEI
jgi:hypothetical protein